MRKIVNLFLLFISSGLFAQQPLTLNDAINLSLKNSYDIQLAKNNLEIAGINNYIGIAGGLPVVTGNANDNEQITSINQKFADPARDTKRDNVGSNNLTANITGSMLLYNGNRVVATKKRLEELLAQNQQILNGQIQNTIASVMTKYYDVVRQQSFLKTILTSIDVSKKRLEILQVRKEVGISNNADILQAELDLNALLQSLQTQELLVEQTKTDLLNLIFMKPDTKISVKDTIIVDKKIVFDTIQSRLNTHPLVLAANQQIHINELIEREAAALRYPTLRASTGYNLTSNKSAAGFSLLNQSYGPFIGLNLAIPIYNGNISKRQQQVASINTRSATIQRDNLLLDYETGMIRTYQLYQNTLNQIQLEQKNTELSTQLLDLILIKFQYAQATIIDVKQAQQSFENAGYRLVNLNYAAKAAEIELKRLANLLGL